MLDVGQQARADFAREGFICIRKALDQNTIDQLREESRALWSEVDLNDPPKYVHWRDRIDGTRVADRLDPVQVRSDVFQDICTSSAIHDIAVQLLGGPVFVLKDKLITKTPGTTGYGPHQDMPYWESSGLQADDVLSIAIALSEITSEHGPMELFPGHHKHRLDSDPSGLDLSETALNQIGVARTALMSPGDALCFHSLVPHRSASNHAETARPLYLVTFARDRGNKEQALQAYNRDLSRVHSAHLREKQNS